MRDDSDTVSLLTAAKQLGISKSMAYRLAATGGELTDGVKVLRFGSTTRPVYRVSKATLAATLQLSDPLIDPALDDDEWFLRAAEVLEKQSRQLQDLLAQLAEMRSKAAGAHQRLRAVPNYAS